MPRHVVERESLASPRRLALPGLLADTRFRLIGKVGVEFDGQNERCVLSRVIRKVQLFVQFLVDEPCNTKLECVAGLVRNLPASFVDRRRRYTGRRNDVVGEPLILADRGEGI